MTAVAIQHRDSIIQRLQAGEYLHQIAVSLGLSPHATAISNALASDPEYQAAREASHDARLINREEELAASERDDVPRARELLSHARWRAERECPARWGNRVDVTINIPSLDRALDLAAQRATGASLGATVIAVESKPVENQEDSA